MCGFIAQLVEHRTGIAEVTVSNPVEALIFFNLHPSNCLNWKIYCDDQSSLLLQESYSLWYAPLLCRFKLQQSDEHGHHCGTLVSLSLLQQLLRQDLH